MSQYYDELKELLEKNLENHQLYHILNNMDIPIMSKLKCCFVKNGWGENRHKTENI